MHVANTNELAVCFWQFLILTLNPKYHPNRSGRRKRRRRGCWLWWKRRERVIAGGGQKRKEKMEYELDFSVAS